MRTHAPEDSSGGTPAPPCGPPDPEFDWLISPLLLALGAQADSPVVRAGVAAAEQRFREMSGRLDLTQHSRAQQLARRAVEDGVRVARLQHAFAAPDLDLPTLMARAVTGAAELVRADGCTMELLESDALVVHAACGRMEPVLGQASDLIRTLSGRALAEQRVLFCDDVEHDDRVDRALARRLGVRAVVVAPLRAGDTMVGVLLAAYARPHAFSDRDVGNLRILGEALGVILDRQRIAARLRASEAQYRALFERNPQPLFVTALDGHRVLAANHRAERQYGYEAGGLLGRPLEELVVHGSLDALSEQDFGEQRMRHRRRDGSEIEVAVSATTIDIDGRAARLLRCLDISARLRAEQALARVSRAQRMLSACNESLVRASSEQALLQELCRITVEIGGYAMAWVGVAQDDAARSLVPLASVGDTAGLIGQMPLSWAADQPAGQGPVGQTIRSGQLVIVPDIAHSGLPVQWIEALRAQGYVGMVCLPLREGERTFGLFNLYLRELATPADDEVELLKALADDLAYGIVTQRAREQQRRAQETQQRIQTAMFKVAAAVSASTGTEFFEQLALSMADALDAQAACIASFGAGLQARTLGAVVDGQVQPNFEASLAGTGLAALLPQGFWIVTQDAQRTLAAQVPLASIGAQAYAGHSLFDAVGQVVGLVLVAFREPLRERQWLASTLRIFAVRAAAELDRLRADERIRHQASLLDKARDAIVVCDLQGRVQYWNKSAERLYGWRAEEALGQCVATLLFEDEAHTEQARAALMRSGEWNGEVARRRQQGSPVQVEARWTLVRDEQGEARSVLMIDTDITQRKLAEAKIQKLAFYDGLTSLPNRQLLHDRLLQALASCVRHHSGGALLCLDLDNFKTLNDTLGHDKGDLLLQQVALRLVSCVREVDTVARLGGDEFVIVLEELSAVPEEVAVQARRVGEKILAALAQPYRLDGYEHQCSASMGVARFGADTSSGGELLKQADIAMYQAKAAGRNTLRFFDPGLEAAVTARAALEGDLRQAFVQREFFLQYQPQVDGQGRVLGVEALVRWRHAARGMVSPAEFIPLAEETGMILLLGQRVLEIACSQLASWRGQPRHAGLSMAVNVSARQFRHADFVRHVRAVLEQTGADPRRLKLELTESVLVDDLQSIVSKMDALKQLGVGFALDDFGTGYSSLGYLKALPLDQLKIDQSFVRDVLSDANDAAIARTVIALARTMGLDVIAEGVETAAQRDFLAREGCQAFQGYHFSRPLEADALARYLETAQVAG